MATLTMTMKFDVDDNAVEELKRLEHHIDYLIDFSEWPEIKSVYDVHVEENKAKTKGE